MNLTEAPREGNVFKRCACSWKTPLSKDVIHLVASFVTLRGSDPELAPTSGLLQGLTPYDIACILANRRKEPTNPILKKFWRKMFACPKMRKNISQIKRFLRAVKKGDKLDRAACCIIGRKLS